MSDRNYIPMTDVFEGVQTTVKLLNYMLGERAQLYGTIIFLMELMGKKEVHMPTPEALREYHNSFFPAFNINEEGEFVVKLIEKPVAPVSPPVDDESDDAEESEDGEEG